MTDSGFAPLGEFEVSATAADVTVFRRAIGLAPDSADLPLTFPIRWLLGPKVKAAIAGLAPRERVVLVHESQVFDYLRPLRVGETYVLMLAARREAPPDRLIVRGTIADASGLQHAALETILRLFSTAAVAA